MKTLLYLALVIAALTATPIATESTHPEQITPPENIAGSF